MRKNIFTKIAAVAAATVLAVTALPALVSDTQIGRASCRERV